MMPGIFEGLWSGVSGTIGQGIGFTQHLYDEKNGIGDKNREYALMSEAQKAKQKEKLIIITGIILVIIVAVVMIAFKNNK